MDKKVRRGSSKKRKPASSGGWQLYVLMPVCGFIIISGFFLAARQHFSSMDYGMRNSRLRHQLDELEAEKRRLLLNREISLSPNEIKKAAKKAGLFEASVSNAQPMLASATAAEKKPSAAPAVAVSTVRPSVVKTAMVIPSATAAPTASRTSIASTAPERERRVAKNTTAAE